MNTAVQVYEEKAVMSAADVRTQVNRVQEVMRSVMQEGTHFGTIPGTPKPSLWKPGAEKLCMAFRIAVSFRTEDLSTEDCVRYRMTAIGVHQTTGLVLGEGLGEASSNEEKYKWRKAGTAEWNATPENRRRIKFYGDGEAKQVRTEPADVANTILKMAAKRAHVAMTLNVTAAGDIFTQDIEDLPPGLSGEDDERPAPPRDSGAKKSRTEALREKLTVKTEVVVKAFEEATSTEALRPIVEMAKKVKEGDREAVNNAYHRALERLRPKKAQDAAQDATEAGGYSDEELLAQIASADTDDKRALVQDVIRSVKDDTRRKVLEQAYERKHAQVHASV